MNDWAPVKYLAVLATGFLLGAWAVNHEPEQDPTLPRDSLYYPGKIKSPRKKFPVGEESEELIAI